MRAAVSRLSVLKRIGVSISVNMALPPAQRLIANRYNMSIYCIVPPRSCEDCAPFIFNIQPRLSPHRLAPYMQKHTRDKFNVKGPMLTHRAFKVTRYNNERAVTYS